MAMAEWEAGYVQDPSTSADSECYRLNFSLLTADAEQSAPAIIPNTRGMMVVNTRSAIVIRPLRYGNTAHSNSSF